MIGVALAHVVAAVAAVLYIVGVLRYFEARGGTPWSVAVLVGILFIATTVAHYVTRRAAAARRLLWPPFVAMPVCLVVIAILGPVVGRHIGGPTMIAIAAVFWGAFLVHWTVFYVTALACTPAAWQR